MKPINCILIFLMLLLGGGLHAQTDSIISVSGEVGNFESGFDFLNEVGGITRFPRLTDAGELVYYVPIVSTDSVPTTTIGISVATVYGNILFNGWYETVLEQGFQISTDADFSAATTYPVVSSNPYADCNLPCPENVFYYSFTELTAGTTYYVRTYATNSMGTAYGDVKTFTTIAVYLPTVTTNSASSITTTGATLSGNVTSDGNATVTARGFVYGTSANNLSQTVQSGSGTGSFTKALTGLTSNTTYYYKAYATNSAGTAYGDVKQFTTECNCGTLTVTDYDGNTYRTVQIGNQCWMAQNLKTTHFADGTSISLSSSSSYQFNTNAYRSYPNNSSSNVSKYGYLYNWYAAMHGASSSSSNPSNRRGVCPTGWHLPSKAEWTQFTNYLKSKSEYCCGSSYIAKSIASTTGWSSHTQSCAVGNNPANNNSTGFCAYPAGGGGDLGQSTYFWSATEKDSDIAYTRGTTYSDFAFRESTAYKHEWHSVRCVKD